MADSDQLLQLKRGVHIWNDWRDKNPNTKPDLRAAQLREANLGGYNLAGVDLRGANLMGANFAEADLRGADLSFADLRFAEFPDTLLIGASFRESQGVSDETLRATAGPGRLRRALPYIAVGTVLTLAIGGAFLLFPAEELLAAFGLGEQPEDTPEPSEIVLAIQQTEFPGWNLFGVETAEQQLTVQVDRLELDQQTYVPTLGVVCGAIAASQAPRSVDQITILNRDATQGWVYQAAEECADLVKAPAKLMRLAIIGGSEPYQPPNPETD